LFADQPETPCAGAGAFEFIALGSDNDLGDDADIGDTAGVFFGTEVARAEGSGEQDGPIVILNNTFTAVAEGAPEDLEDGEVVGETALFDIGDEGFGNMLARVTLPLTEVVTGDEIFIEWTITGSIVAPGP